MITTSSQTADLYILKFCCCHPFVIYLIMNPSLRNYLSSLCAFRSLSRSFLSFPSIALGCPFTVPVSPLSQPSLHFFSSSLSFYPSTVAIVSLPLFNTCFSSFPFLSLFLHLSSLSLLSLLSLLTLYCYLYTYFLSHLSLSPCYISLLPYPLIMYSPSPPALS